MAESIRILVVNDDSEEGALTAEFLERTGDEMVVGLVTDPEEALSRLRGWEPNCVVSDYKMPVIDGIEFLKAVRAERPELPFILFTGKGSEEVASDAISAGATDYLRKRSGAEQYELLANRVRNAIEKHRSAVRLRQTREEYATVFENVQSGLLLVDVAGGDFVYRHCNARFSEFTGLSDEEVVGRTPREVLGPGGGQKVAAAYRACIERRESIEFTVGFDLPAGHVIQECAVTPVPADRGIEQLVVSAQDITEQREREAELRQYEQIVTTMQEFACIYDTEGRFEVVNSYLASFYEMSPETLVGRKSRLIPEIQANAAGDPYRELLEGERSEIRGEVTLEFPGRGEVSVAYRFTPLVVDGEIVGAVAVANDVTHHRERERELEQKNQQLEEFASVVSHDLRNPLNVVRGRLELLEEGTPGEHVEVIDRNLARMESIIDDVLTLPRDGATLDEIESVALGTVASGCWQSVDTGSATLDVDAEQTIRADGDRLRRLFENLYRNAVEHGTAGDRVGDAADSTPEVTVGTLTEGFYVEDDGPGIPEAEREQVFEAGYSTAEDGTGFGLRIVKQIATAHGWEVEVTDGSDGGARFVFTGVEFGEADN